MNKNILDTREVTSKLYDFILQEVEKKKIVLIEQENILDVLTKDKELILGVQGLSYKSYAYGFKQYIEEQKQSIDIVRFFTTGEKVQKVFYYIDISTAKYSEEKTISLVPVWDSIGSVSCGRYDVPQPGKKIELGKYILKGESVFDQQYGEDIWVWDLA